jgi:hypothetical protein
LLKPTPEELAVYDELKVDPDDFSSWMKDYVKDARDPDSQMQIYCASMTSLDAAIGKLLDYLDAAGLADNTLILFSSDNGPEDYHVGNASNSGLGSPAMFNQKYWLDFNNNRAYPATASIDEVLNDPVVMASSAEAVLEVDEQVEAILAETGLTEAYVVPIPFLHMEVDGASIAYQPGIVNGLVIDGSTFIAPDPHGPVVNGEDVLKKAAEEEFGRVGVTVLWNEDWDMYHRLSGEVHCASNVRRAVPDDAKWWEAAQ